MFGAVADLLSIVGDETSSLSLLTVLAPCATGYQGGIFLKSRSSLALFSVNWEADFSIVEKGATSNSAAGFKNDG